MTTGIKTRIAAARATAICADLLQIGLFPLFSPGLISPLDDALDLAVCIALTYLVGWHYSFLPSFLVKVLSMFDLAPTWTIAVFLVTRQKRDLGGQQTTQVYDIGRYTRSSKRPRRHSNSTSLKLSRSCLSQESARLTTPSNRP